MASQIASLEEDRTAYQEQLDVVQGQLKDDPDNAELQLLKTELDEMIILISESLSELQPKEAPSQSSPPLVLTAAPGPMHSPVPKPQEKGLRHKYLGFRQKGADPSASHPAQPAVGEDKEESHVQYQVNDEVLAKWLSGDKKFWPARIMSVTGSAAARIYIVKFKNYKGTETLRAKDIRLASNKRKADGPPATTPTTTPMAGGPVASAAAGSSVSAASGTGAVLSAAPSLYPDQAAGKEAEKNPRDIQGRPPKAKKIKANKELEAGKNKWQEFNAKTKKLGKAHKKESMFRTPEGIHGRVGFTGSGQAMRKDPSRSRHVYQMNDDAD